MKMIRQFIDYGFHVLHRKEDQDRLYSIVDIEVLFSAWHTMKYRHSITDKAILRVVENDIEDFVFKMDFYNFFISANDIHDYLIGRYKYDTKQFEKKRNRELSKIKRRARFFDFVIRYFGQ